jgi:hypothetical protein
MPGGAPNPRADLWYGVAVVDRVEEDAIDGGRVGQRRDEVRYEVVARRGVGEVPEPADAVLVARVLLLAVRAAELEAAAAALQEEALVPGLRLGLGLGLGLALGLGLGLGLRVWVRSPCTAART